MAVKRIVANIATPDPARAAAFYGGLLGMPVVMDHGWIVTHGGQGSALAQVSFASEGVPAPRCPICRSKWTTCSRCWSACTRPASRWSMALPTSRGECVVSSSATRSGGC